MVFLDPIFPYLSASEASIYDLGKARISIFNSVIIGLCVGQFVYSDENGAEEFQSRAGCASPGWPLHLPALATLGILGTALAMVLMNSLVRYSSAVAASSVTYVIPVFAILWGVLDGEKITLLHLGCMGLILSGVYLISRKKKN